MRRSDNSKKHPYLRGAAYWLKKLAFWKDEPGRIYNYSEKSKEYYEQNLQP